MNYDCLLTHFTVVVIPRATASRLSKGALTGILLGSIAGAVILSAVVTGLIMKRCSAYRRLSNKRSSKFFSYHNNTYQVFLLGSRNLCFNLKSVSIELLLNNLKEKVLLLFSNNIKGNSKKNNFN